MRLLITIAVQAMLISQLAYSQSDGSINIVSTIVAQFIVTDPLGRRTGVDPRGGSNPLGGVRIRQIPGAAYSIGLVGDSPDDTSANIRDEDVSFEFNYFIKASENDGVYKIETIGTEKGIYTIYIHVFPFSKSSIQPYSVTVSGIIDSMQTNVYEIDYHSARGTPIGFRKLVSTGTLRQDILVSFAKNWLGDRSFYEDLNQRLDLFESLLSQRNSVRAQNVLQGLRMNLDDASQQSSGTIFITHDAYEILSRDVTTLLNQLPPKP